MKGDWMIKSKKQCKKSLNVFYGSSRHCHLTPELLAAIQSTKLFIEEI